MRSRRQILRGAGVAIGLPLLESLVPRRARAAAAGPVKRFAALFFPNGSTMRQDWTLTGSGTSYTMGAAHGALAPFKSKFSMFKNLSHASEGSPAHSRGTIRFLTDTLITDQNTPKADVSIDQAIVKALAPPTPMGSLHLGPLPYPGGAPSDTGWASGYNVYISWASPTAPNPPLESAQVAFDKVFAAGGSSTVMPDPTVAKRLRLKKSVLDYVVAEVQHISPRLGQSDGKKLDEYLTSIRDVETRLQKAQDQQQSPPPAGCAMGMRPGSGLDIAGHTRAMLDILVLAFQCDATRVLTYSMDYGFGNKYFAFLGFAYARHHSLSHSGTDQLIIDAHKAIVKWYMEQLAYLLGKMDAIDEGGATLLDNSIVYLGSDVGEAWSHDHSDLTAILAGKGAGALNPGRLIDASGKSYASYLMALAAAMGAPVTSFAGASAPMTGL